MVCNLQICQEREGDKAECVPAIVYGRSPSSPPPRTPPRPPSSPPSASAMDGHRNGQRMRLSVHETRQENTMHPIRGGSTELWHVQARIRSSPDAGEAAPRGHASMRGRGEEESRSLSWSLNQVYPSHRLRIGRALAAQGVDGTVHPLATVCGGESTRRRAESRQARPGRGDRPAVNARSTFEAPAIAIVSTKHRALCLRRCALALPLGSAPVGGRPPWCSIARSVCSDERAARGDAAASTPDVAPHGDPRSCRWPATVAFNL